MKNWTIQAETVRVHKPKTMSCIWKKYINLVERIILPVIVSMKKRQPRKDTLTLFTSCRGRYQLWKRILSVCIQLSFEISKSAFPVINIERSRVRVFRVDWRVLKISLCGFFDTLFIQLLILHTHITIIFNCILQVQICISGCFKTKWNIISWFLLFLARRTSYLAFSKQS